LIWKRLSSKAGIRVSNNLSSTIYDYELSGGTIDHANQWRADTGVDQDSSK
jgi:hypothetical protein